MFLETLIAALAVALLSLTGVFFFGKSGHLGGSHRFIIPAAMGVFLGVIFFELIPETLEAAGVYGSIAIVGGFLSFYILSYLLRTFHHHEPIEEGVRLNRGGATRLLIGDSIHNIADGVVIATAFIANPAIGVAATLGVALHEVPQEIAEFGVLIRAGFSKMRAAFYNVLSALSIVLGVLLTFLIVSIGDFVWVLTGIAAGNLLYIATSDMIPELNREEHHSHFWQTFIATLLGLVAITLLLSWSHERFAHIGEDSELHEEVHEEH